MPELAVAVCRLTSSSTSEAIRSTRARAQLSCALSSQNSSTRFVISRGPATRAG